MTTPSDDADADFTVTPADITAADSADKTALNSADEISELMKDYGISQQPQGFTGGSGAGAGSEEDGSPQLQRFTGGSGAGAGSKGSGSRQPRFTGTLVAGARRAGRSSAVRGRTIKVGAGAVAAAAVVVAGGYAAVGAVLASPHAPISRVSAVGVTATVPSSTATYNPVTLSPVPHVSSARPKTRKVAPQSHRHRKTGGQHAAAPPVAQAPPAPAPPPAPPPSGPFKISGSVSCISGNGVEGVWVAAGSGAGWSPWQGQGNGATATFWYTLPKKESYSLHVGCGGSPSSWKVATYSVTVSTAVNNFACDDVPGQANYGTCRTT